MTEELNNNATNDDVFIAEADEFDDNLDAELPKWPKVVGIISIVFGSIGIICKGAGTAMAPLQPAGMKAQFPDGAPPVMLSVNTLLIVVSVLSVLVSITLLVAGIMLVLRKHKARMLHIAYSMVSVILAVWSISIQLDTMSKIEQWVNDNPGAAFSSSPQATMSSGTVALSLLFGATLLFMVWPIFCFVWFAVIKKNHEDMTGGVDLDTI